MFGKLLYPYGKVRPILLVGLLITLVLVAICCAVFVWYFLREIPEEPIDVRCPPLPETFKESDLIGTWVASYIIYSTDTLFIRENGTYKQVFEDNDPETNYHYHYESDWQEWWIEYRESGYLRLHLKGMRRFDSGDSEIFNRVNGGLGPEDPWAIDTCEYVKVPMQDEVVLIVTGVSERAKNTTPRGIELRHARLAGSDWYWSFRLQED